MADWLKAGSHVHDVKLDCIVVVIEVLDWRRSPFLPTARVIDVETKNVYETPIEWLRPISD
jgi:hypothetical protein